jgi:sugar phosphate isomerase/epimerase
MDLSANQYVCPNDYGVERFLDEAVAAGFQQVALTRMALAEMSPAKLRRAIVDRGLSVTTLNSAGYFTWGDPDRRAAQEAENQSLVEAAVELEAGALCVITGGCAEQPDLDTARACIRDCLAELDTIASAAGVRLGLEPIHPKDVATKGCINSIAQACALIASLEATGLIVDLFHSFWDTDLMSVAADPDICALQICNVTAEPKRSADLGDGMLDVSAIVRGFREAGYDGPVEFEIFAADHGQTNVAPILQAAADWANA